MTDYRSDFPLLTSRGFRKDVGMEHDWIYIDNAATSQRPQAVLDAEEEFYKEHNANPLRGNYPLSIEATQMYEDARKAVRDFIGAKSVREIIFTRNTTEGINLVAYSYALPRLKPGDEILVTIMEHHSNLLPWQMAARRTGATLKYLECEPDGSFTEEKICDAVTPHTKLAALTLVSNVLGRATPAEKLIGMVHENGGVVLADAAQAAPHMPIDVTALDVDFLAFSGHKLMAPMGIGVLYGKQELLEEMPPFLGGGDMVDTVTFAKTTYAPVPLKFEAGTANFSGAIALGEAVKFVQRFDPEEVERHEQALLRRATERLAAIDGLRIYGTAPGKCAIVSFNVEGVHPYDMGMILDKLGIAVRTGQHCAEPVMDHYGTTGMCRASFALYNTLAEADALAAGVERAVKMLRN